MESSYVVFEKAFIVKTRTTRGLLDVYEGLRGKKKKEDHKNELGHEYAYVILCYAVHMQTPR